MKAAGKIVYALICATIIFTKECYGYLDPSAMTYVIQIGAAVGITIATSIGILFYKIKKFFKRKKHKDDDIDELN